MVDQEYTRLSSDMVAAYLHGTIKPEEQVCVRMDPDHREFYMEGAFRIEVRVEGVLEGAFRIFIILWPSGKRSEVYGGGIRRT